MKTLLNSKEIGTFFDYSSQYRSSKNSRVYLFVVCQLEVSDNKLTGGRTSRLEKCFGRHFQKCRTFTWIFYLSSGGLPPLSINYLTYRIPVKLMRSQILTIICTLF